MSKVVKAIIMSVLLVALSVGGAIGALYTRLQKFGDTPLADGKAPAVRVMIPRGANTQAISAVLETEGVIKSARQFYLYTRFIKRSDHLLRPGEYDLTPTMTPQQVMQKLIKGEVVTYKFTVPEGANLKDIARIISASKLATEADLLAAMHEQEFCWSLDVPRQQESLEGYLFPDTYRFPSGVTAKEILKVMRQRTAKVMTPEVIEKGKALKLNPHQILTLASIVEKETGQGKERPIISAVFHNRIKLDMKLQTDPTVIYGIPDFEGNITKRHLETPHPYNTYIIKGLPPGPIASPGQAAIEAAVAPADTKALFFVSRNDGSHEFCETLTCHNKNVQKWQVDFFKGKRASK